MAGERSDEGEDYLGCFVVLIGFAAACVLFGVLVGSLS